MSRAVSIMPAGERRPRILIVDDSAQMVETLARYLAARGFEPVTATDVDGALDLFSTAGVAAVVTDLRMQGLDGLDLLDTIRARAPELPVIIMTAFGTVESAVEAMKRGAFHYLAKPFRMAELRMLLEHATAASGERRGRGQRGGLGSVDGAVGQLANTGAPRDPFAALVPLGLTLHQVEDGYIEAVLAAAGGNRTRASQILGVDPSTLYRRGRGGGQGNGSGGSGGAGPGAGPRSGPTK